MKIEGLRNYRGGPTIDELPEPRRSRARQWRSRLLEQARRCGRPIQGWYLAIIEGQAKRLSRMTPEELSAWGRSMCARLGGLAVQILYRHTGRFEEHQRMITERSSLNRAARKRQRDAKKALDKALIITRDWRCARCQHRWTSRKQSAPNRCPFCFARTWNRPKKKPGRKPQ